MSQICLVKEVELQEVSRYHLEWARSRKRPTDWSPIRPTALGTSIVLSPNYSFSSSRPPHVKKLPPEVRHLIWDSAGVFLPRRVQIYEESGPSYFRPMPRSVFYKLVDDPIIWRINIETREDAREYGYFQLKFDKNDSRGPIINLEHDMIFIENNASTLASFRDAVAKYGKLDQVKRIAVHTHFVVSSTLFSDTGTLTSEVMEEVHPLKDFTNLELIFVIFGIGPDVVKKDVSWELKTITGNLEDLIGDKLRDFLARGEERVVPQIHFVEWQYEQDGVWKSV